MSAAESVQAELGPVIVAPNVLQAQVRRARADLVLAEERLRHGPNRDVAAAQAAINRARAVLGA